MGLHIGLVFLFVFAASESHGLAIQIRGKNIHVDELEGVVAWVDFGKTGSSSLAQVLAKRHNNHGWPQDRFFMRGLCHAKREELEWNTSELPQCHDQPDGAVIATDFGYCELLRSVRGCRYMTLLREPISRMISSYNYFCLHCSEGGKACAQAQGPGAVTCPNMSIVDYAGHFGNDYVRMFAGKDRGLCQQSPSHTSNIARLKSTTMADGMDDAWTMDMIHRQSCRADFGHAHDQENEGDYAHAMQTLTNSSTLVLCLENQLADELSVAQQLARFLHDDALQNQQQQLPMANAHSHSYEPNADEIQKISKILEFDKQLYAAFCQHG